jgi:signal peptide peptidase SppA
MKYERIISAISATPWMIHPPKLEEIIGVIEARLSGVQFSAEEIAAYEQRERRETALSGGVAVMPLVGTISQRVGLMTGSGGVSADEFGRQFDALVNSPDVSAIVMDADTSGGSAAGVDELSAKIHKARGKKPIVAVVNSKMHSAGYYIGSAADEVVMAPGGMAGSIGVVTAHVDQSKFNDEIGIKVTYIHAGKNKVQGNPDEPLGDDARADIQRIVDAYNTSFVAAVARNRGVSKSQVNENFGQGKIFTAKEAVSLGMADRVATLESVIAELSRKTRTNSRMRAERRFGFHKAS